MCVFSTQLNQLTSVERVKCAKTERVLQRCVSGILYSTYLQLAYIASIIVVVVVPCYGFGEKCHEC